MTEWDREQGELIERLLASADADEPPAGARDRELARLGLLATGAAVAAAGAGAGAVAGAGGSTGAGAGGASVAAGTGALLSGGALAKLGLLGGVTIVVSWLAVGAPMPPSAATATASASPQATFASVSVASSAVAPPLSSALVQPALLASAATASGVSVANDGPAPAPPKATRPIAAAPTTSDPSTLAAEVALVDRARSLANRSPAEALAILDEHQRTYPNGVLRDEAAVARLEALLAAGRRADAARVAEPFLRARAGTPIARRMSVLLESADP